MVTDQGGAELVTAEVGADADEAQRLALRPMHRDAVGSHDSMH